MLHDRIFPFKNVNRRKNLALLKFRFCQGTFVVRQVSFTLLLNLIVATVILLSTRGTAGSDIWYTCSPDRKGGSATQLSRVPRSSGAGVSTDRPSWARQVSAEGAQRPRCSMATCNQGSTFISAQWFAQIPSGRAGRSPAVNIWNKPTVQNLTPMVRHNLQRTGGQSSSS